MVSVKNDGSVVALVGLYEMEEDNEFGKALGFFLTEYDLNGLEKSETAVEEGFRISDDAAALGVHMGIDGDGNILIVDNDVAFLSSQGLQLAEPLVDAGKTLSYLVRSADGSLIGCESGTGADPILEKVNFKTGTMEKLEKLPFYPRGLGRFSESDGSR